MCDVTRSSAVSVRRRLQLCPTFESDRIAVVPRVCCRNLNAVWAVPYLSYSSVQPDVQALRKCHGYTRVTISH